MKQATDTGALEAQHRHLEALFRQHQHALLARESEQATALLHQYRQQLAAHIAAEDRLMDVIEQRGITTEWPLRVYRLEHARLLKLVDELLAQVAELTREDLQPQRLIELIELEKTVKGVAEHHDLREERDLYPACRQQPV